MPLSLIPWLNSELWVCPWLTSYPSTHAATTIFTTTDLRATSGLCLPSSRSRLYFPILHHQITSRGYLLPGICIHLTAIVIQTFITCSFIPSQVIKIFLATNHITCLCKFTFFFNSKSHQSFVTWYVNPGLGCYYGFIFIKAHKITLESI